MAREINLVPDVKAEMIKALKTRNLILFISIVVAIASVVITIIVSLVVAGQQIVLNDKEETLNSLSSKVNSYDELTDYLTIKDQLGNLSTLSAKHNVLSRTFDILYALLPHGADTVKISELDVDLTTETPTFVFEAQADAGTEPYIDYNVLDSFKKSMQYMRYDFGRYVDKNGDTIPAYCMIEKNSEGSIFQDSDKGIYAYWTINKEGCNPNSENSTSDYSLEDYEDQSVVRVWRTPQFQDWYKETKKDDQPYMGLDGTVSGVEHFESSCITYTGNTVLNGEPKWTEANDTCLLIPENSEGIQISDSSNGRDAKNKLVLRFSATIPLAPEVYKFSNTHMLAIAPAGKRNVTDSYIQLQAMFAEPASDCKPEDTDCNSDPTAKKEKQDQESGGNE